MITSNKILTLAIITAILFPISAQAGFEWQPPAKIATPIVAPTPIVQDNETMVAVPRAPVIAQELDAPSFERGAPIPLIQPQQQLAVTSQRVVKPTITKTGGLYIDPYPLQNNNALNKITDTRMNQAITEKSRALNPVQLGSGMTTGVRQSQKYVSRPVIVSNQGKSIASIGINSLTPMMGDEPAPLPGYGLGMVEYERTRQYEQAVGFGKNLPLALAISQVIPSAYTHRFDGDISPSAMVDWSGGKPWNVVLNDMLRDENMMADIEGNVVVIKEIAKI